MAADIDGVNYRKKLPTLLCAKARRPSTDATHQFMRDAADAIERLHGALVKIANRYPCETISDMRRVAAEAIGLPAPEADND